MVKSGFMAPPALRREGDLGKKLGNGQKNPQKFLEVLIIIRKYRKKFENF